eukprot:2070214-Ditylum_brightwellii.AAC.1
MDRYGQIKPADLIENELEYTKLMDTFQPIDAYFARIDNCINTKIWLVQGWYKRVKAKDPADQTWQNFKKDFAKEYDEIKEEQE